MKPRQPRKGVRRAPRRDTLQPDTHEQQGDLLESQPESQSVSTTSEDTQPVLSTTDSGVDGAIIHEIPQTQESMPQNENTSSSDVVESISPPKDLATQAVAEQAVEALAENVDKTASHESVATPNHVSVSTPDAANTPTEAISPPAAPREAREAREPRQHPQNNNRPSARQNHQHNNAPRQPNQVRQSQHSQSNRHEQLDFEAALRELETIVVQMEGSGLSLQDSLAAYQRGSRLVQQCQHWLSDAEQQVQVLENNMLSSSGEF